MGESGECRGKVIAIEGFGERLKLAREEAHLTQEGLATNAGLGVGTIVKYESAQRTPRERTVIARLAAAVGKTSAWLIIGPGALEEGQEGVLADAEARGYRRALAEMRGKLLGVIDDAERAAEPKARVHRHGTPLRPAEDLEAELREREQGERGATRARGD